MPKKSAPIQSKAPKSKPPQPKQPKTNSAVEKWARMMVAPGESEVVRSPAGTSLLASEARIVRSFDIPYADTHNGYFGVVCRPSLTSPIIKADSQPRTPSSGFTSVECVSDVSFSPDHEPAGSPESGFDYFAVANEDYQRRGSSWYPVTAGAVTYLCSNVVMALGSTLTISLQNKSKHGQYFKLLYYKAGAWNPSTAIYIGGGNSRVLVDGTVTTANVDAYTVVVCDDAGTLINPKSQTKVSLYSAFSQAYLPASAGTNIVGSFVADELVEAAHVTNARVTAMSLLITNVAAATKDGGEIVMASTRESIVNRSHTINDLMNSIKSLPETNRWYSGLVREGGYTFYAPDDLESYEPRPDYSYLNLNDNCCIGAGVMDDGGKIRVICTYIVEWYSPAQFFKRSLGPSWNRQYKMMLRVIQSGNMASGNPTHREMVRSIARNVHSTLVWALKNKDALMTTGQLIASLL